MGKKYNNKNKYLNIYIIMTSMSKVDKLLIKHFQEEYKCSYTDAMSKHLINLKTNQDEYNKWLQKIIINP